MAPDRRRLLGGGALVARYALPLLVGPPVLAVVVSVGHSDYRYHETA